MEESSGKDWDPRPAERTYYRSNKTGDRGYLVRRDGRDMVRLDQPMHEALRRLDPNEWQPDHELRRLSRPQMAMVAWVADQELARALGFPADAKREWRDIPEHKRIKWMETGPKNPVRKFLFEAIMETLEEVNRD
jgi:hypothetical protein